MDQYEYIFVFVLWTRKEASIGAVVLESARRGSDSDARQVIQRLVIGEPCA